MASEENKVMKKVLVFGGKTGWIGGIMVDMLGKEGTVMMEFLVIYLLKKWILRH
jgi:hypothetical protein